MIHLTQHMQIYKKFGLSQGHISLIPAITQKKYLHSPLFRPLITRMGIKELFEGIRNNLRRHDGSLEDRLNYYENKIGKGDTLSPEERREYLENKGIGSLDPQSLTLEEVTSSQGAKRSLLFQWTKSDFLKANPKNLERIPKSLLTKEALINTPRGTNDSVLTNLFRNSKEHIVPKELLNERFLTANSFGQENAKPIGTTILAKLIEAAGARAIPESLKTKEFLLKDPKENYMALVAEKGELFSLPQELITPENLINNKTEENMSILYLVGKHDQLDRLPKEFLSKEVIEENKYYYIEAVTAACNHYNSGVPANIPPELRTKEMLETPIAPNERNAIQAAAIAGRIQSIPPKILANNLFYTNRWSESDRFGGRNVLDLMFGLSKSKLNPKEEEHLGKSFKYLDKKSLEKIETDYPSLKDIVAKKRDNRILKENPETAIA
jgi:hypothetical protein